MLSQLAKLGVVIERYNLAQQPLAFARIAQVRAMLEKHGPSALPLIFWDGELHLQFDGRTVVARPGDMAYLPEGSHVSLNAPAKVRLACINGLA